jgi:hypothetical protein
VLSILIYVLQYTSCISLLAHWLKSEHTGVTMASRAQPVGRKSRIGATPRVCDMICPLRQPSALMKRRRGVGDRLHTGGNSTIPLFVAVCLRDNSQFSALVYALFLDHSNRVDANISCSFWLCGLFLREQ